MQHGDAQALAEHDRSKLGEFLDAGLLNLSQLYRGM